MNRRLRWRWRCLVLCLLLFGLVTTARGSWMICKAELAQVLLQQAWGRAQAGATRTRPWPWADTWPVARLSAPELREELIVLAGGSGRTLAFGPGHLDGSAAPGKEGNTVLVGHRDTHFAFLRHLAPGNVLVLETPDGARHRYQVQLTEIVHETSIDRLLPVVDERRLTLITCYPFDAVIPGGPLRWVVCATGV